MKKKSFRTFITQKLNDYIEYNNLKIQKKFSILFRNSYFNKDERMAEICIAYFFSKNENSKAREFNKILRTNYLNINDIQNDKYFKYTIEYKSYLDHFDGFKKSVKAKIINLSKNRNMSFREISIISKLDYPNMMNFINGDNSKLSNEKLLNANRKITSFLKENDKNNNFWGG